MLYQGKGKNSFFPNEIFNSKNNLNFIVRTKLDHEMF